MTCLPSLLKQTLNRRAFRIQTLQLVVGTTSPPHPHILLYFLQLLVPSSDSCLVSAPLLPIQGRLQRPTAAGAHSMSSSPPDPASTPAPRAGTPPATPPPLTMALTSALIQNEKYRQIRARLTTCTSTSHLQPMPLHATSPLCSPGQSRNYLHLRSHL